MKKHFFTDRKIVNVELHKEGDFFIVTVDGDVYKKTPNELFAVQVFNAI